MCEQGGNIECVNRVANIVCEQGGNIECVNRVAIYRVNRWQYIE